MIKKEGKQNRVQRKTTKKENCKKARSPKDDINSTT